jgi:hypothetical protein
LHDRAASSSIYFRRRYGIGIKSLIGPEMTACLLSFASCRRKILLGTLGLQEARSRKILRVLSASVVEDFELLFE